MYRHQCQTLAMISLQGMNIASLCFMRLYMHIGQTYNEVDDGVTERLCIFSNNFIFMCKIRLQNICLKTSV